LLLPELKAFYGFIELIILLVAVYSFFNVRKTALAFAGDIGSIVLGLCIALPILLAISKSGRWWYLVFFSLYLIDAGFTLMVRLFKGYNILKPHRTHLYEYLVNEVGQSHLFIASLYAAIQFMVNLILIFCAYIYLASIYYVACILFLSCFGAYLLIRYRVEKKYVGNPVNG
jgi:UDP-N-acetylmuramyl pentapeptide phosphotransferase/UDP-N-acetylglucosamine-1-phosphate transferase